MYLEAFSMVNITFAAQFYFGYYYFFSHKK